MLKHLSIRNLINRLRSDEEGVTALEYALIAALIAVVIIVAVKAVGTQASTTFSNVAGQMEKANH
jgi:pilus assembly protein Flp/PilA